VRVKAGLIAVVAGFAAYATPLAFASSPTAAGAAMPSTVAPGRATLLTVTVSPGTAPTSTGVFVSCNLSAVGGTFNQMFSDEGTDGDVRSGDLVFSYRATVSALTALGSYTLPCVVSDAQGRSTLPSIALSIAAIPNQPPTADAGGPYHVDEGSSVTLSAGGLDPEGAPLSFAWDLNGDSLFEASGASVVFAPDDGPANRIVSVRATDDGGLTADAATTVVVANVAPSATFVAPASADGAFRLSLTSPHDPSLGDTAAGFTYAFDCGSGYGAYGAATTAGCSAAPGNVAVGGEIRDKDGGVSEYRSTVSVGTTYDGLCSLTRALSRKRHIAEALCRKLHRAARARSARRRHAYLTAYRREVWAQSGRGHAKAFTRADAARLTALALLLDRN
jgi:hypothetical protein